MSFELIFRVGLPPKLVELETSEEIRRPKAGDVFWFHDGNRWFGPHTCPSDTTYTNYAAERFRIITVTRYPQ